MWLGSMWSESHGKEKARFSQNLFFFHHRPFCDRSRMPQEIPEREKVFTCFIFGLALMNQSWRVGLDEELHRLHEVNL